MKPAVIYARVSSEQQRAEGYSIPAQIALLREYAAQHGFTVTKEYTEAETAKSTGRRQFKNLIQDAAISGAVILVEKTDRFARNMEDASLIRTMGLTCHLVKEGRTLSPESRPHDWFLHSIMSSIAQFYTDNLSQEVKKGQRQKALEGYYPSYAPVGYVNTQGESGRKIIVPDPAKASHVVRFFELMSSGAYGTRDLAKVAKESGVSSRTGAALGKSAIQRMLHNPVYIGLVWWDGEIQPGKHEPLISKRLFDDVQDILAGRWKGGRFGAKKFLYKGLFTCGHCGCAITAETKRGAHNSGSYTYYHCTNSRGGCPRPFFREEILTEYFEDILQRLVIPPDVVEWVRIALRESFDDEAAFKQAEIEKHRSEETKASKLLQKLYLDRVAGRLDEETYDILRQDAEDRRRDARIHMAALDRAERNYFDEGIAILELSQSAAFEFKHASDEDKRELIGHLVSNPQLSQSGIDYRLKKPFDILVKEHARFENGALVIREGQDYNLAELKELIGRGVARDIKEAVLAA